MFHERKTADPRRIPTPDICNTSSVVWGNEEVRYAHICNTSSIVWGKEESLQGKDTFAIPVQYSSVQDGIYVLKKVHNYALQPVFQKYSQHHSHSVVWGKKKMCANICNTNSVVWGQEEVRFANICNTNSVVWGQEEVRCANVSNTNSVVWGQEVRCANSAISCSGRFAQPARREGVSTEHQKGFLWHLATVLYFCNGVWQC